MATKDAPSTPAASVKGGIFPAFVALNICLKPALTSLRNTAIKVTKSNPVENETIAASNESPISSESAPFTLDCAAINTPEKAERSSRPTTFSPALIITLLKNFYWKLIKESIELMAALGMNLE